MSIFIVSGAMRSGTSMMMKCLEAGGMGVVLDKEKDENMKHLSDEHYQMNESFYELMPQKFFKGDFPLGFEGKVIKILYGGLRRLPKYPSYKIVFMLRHPVEIHASYNAAYKAIIDQTILSGETPKEYPVSPKWYHEFMSKVINVNRKRGVDVITLGYRSVVKNPLRAFRRIKNAGWPIDPEKAAAAVDVRNVRFCIDKLTVRDLQWETA